jgi:hypothetical protein
MGHDLPTYAARWTQNFQPKGVGMGTPNEMAMARETDPNRPWSALPIYMPDKVKAFFSVTMQAKIGDGSSTLFWQDQWLHGQRLVDIALRLVAAIPKRRFNQRTVQQALTENRWALDIQGAITVGVLIEYLQVWETLQSVQLQHGVQDIHFWRFTENRKYTAKAGI